MLLELKKAIRRQFPRSYDRTANLKRWIVDPYERMLWRIGNKANWKVTMGPFAGMRYIRRNYGDRWASRLIGCYEEELHPALEKLIQKPFRNVVNIGSFEGYYSVGLALRMPQAKIYAYDMSPAKQDWCREMAALNGVGERFDIRGTCTAEELAKLNLDAALVICDCEGYEEDILNPSIVPWLRSAAIVVELHPCYRPRVVEILSERFKSTHELTIINASPRNPSNYPVLADETPELALAAVTEDRVTDDGTPAATPWGVWTPRSMA